MENICIFRTPRDRVDEHNHCIKSELEFALRSFPIDKLQTAIRIFEDEDKKIQPCAWLRIARDRPLHPQAVACYSINDDKKKVLQSTADCTIYWNQLRYATGNQNADTGQVPDAYDAF